MRSPEVIVFDWDGTLVDSAADIVASMRQASQSLGVPLPAEQTMRRAIGLGLDEAFAQIFPELSAADRQSLMARYREHHRGRPSRVFGQPFAGVDQVLANLHQSGHVLAVATGKSRAGLDRALASVPWGRLFKETRTADESASKPNPLMLEQLSLRLCVEPEQILMVGDTTYDMQMAAHFGCAAVGVSWGVHEAEELQEHGALSVLDDLAGLPSAIAKHF